MKKGKTATKRLTAQEKVITITVKLGNRRILVRKLRGFPKVIRLQLAQPKQKKGELRGGWKMEAERRTRILRDPKTGQRWFFTNKNNAADARKAIQSA